MDKKDDMREAIDQLASQVRESTKQTNANFAEISSVLHDHAHKFEQLQATLNDHAHKFEQIQNVMSSNFKTVGENFKTVGENFKTVDENFKRIDDDLFKLNVGFNRLDKENNFIKHFVILGISIPGVLITIASILISIRPIKNLFF